jgi:DNA-binding MarR family transcriptional regulator
MLLNNLSIIVRHSRVFAMRKLQKFDIGWAEEVILMFLAGNNNCNQDAISKYFVTDKGTIAKTLSKLEEKKLVERVVNPSNKREKLISLTKEGQEIIVYMKELLMQLEKCVYQGIQKDDIEKFDNLTKIMADNLVRELYDEGENDEKSE